MLSKIRFEENKQRIADAIDSKATQPCPCCGNNKGRYLTPGFMMQPVQDNLESFIIGGETFPMVGTYCEDCGYIQTFVLKILIPDFF